MDSKTLFLAGRIYDLEAISKELKVDLEAKCWSVLLSTKTGDEALSLCCDTSKHKGRNCAPHQPPKNFNLAALSKKYSTQATPAQKKTAGWGGKKQKI